ncbi:hypothetical protein LTR78_004486 [Recurvomyces mirabilis]|uniref:Uncharacterized protein n=1 Tax=Recurvomyces mirabilis TaxID=574656 RepID=A0AAE0WQ75_9PEZI|nr:hypothetical protein LTR78_004486 [Recurvomyces mirabilis]KAK5155848.1 hypothetical protein LTS14_005414 [Recurvomyces mirabilis]
MPPIPIALCGKSSSMASSFAPTMLPEYEIVHHFQSLEAVQKELTHLLRGESFTPTSDLGADDNEAKNAHTAGPPRKPRAVMLGAGFNQEELDEMLKVEGADQVSWLFPDALKSVGNVMTGPFFMTVLAKRVKACLQSNGIVKGEEGKAKGGEVYKF